MPTYPINMGDAKEWQPLDSIVTAGEEVGAGTIDDNNKMLIEAVKSGNINTVKKLLNENNVDIDFRDKSAEGKTALMIASENGFFVVVEKLLAKGANVNLATPVNEYQDSIKQGETALMLASENGHLGIVNQLIKAEAEVDKTNSWGKTALFGACAYGDTKLVETLIVAGADVNQTDNSWETPIFHACRANNHETVRTLITNNANLDVMNQGGQSAIMLACYREHYKFAGILKQYGADTKGLNLAEKFMLGVINFFSRSTKGNQLSPVTTSAEEAEEQESSGKATATSSRAGMKAARDEKISSWFLGISKAELEAQLEQETTLTPSAHFGTSSAASGGIEEARNNQHPSMFSATASTPAPLEVAFITESPSSARPSPVAASSSKAVAIAPTKASPTQTRQ